MLFRKFPILLTGIYTVYHIVDTLLNFSEFVRCQITVLAGLLQDILPQQDETLLHRLLMFQESGQEDGAKIFFHLNSFGNGEDVFVVG